MSSKRKFSSESEIFTINLSCKGKSFEWVSENDPDICKFALNNPNPFGQLLRFREFLLAKEFLLANREKKIHKKKKKQKEVIKTAWSTDITRHTIRHARNDGVEVSQRVKNRMLMKHVGRVFMSGYTSNTSIDQILAWATKDFDKFRVSMVEYRYDPDTHYDYTDSEGFFHSSGPPPVCWCTTKITYIYILSHLDFPRDEFLIGSTCMTYFDSIDSFRIICKRLMSSHKIARDGKATHCHTCHKFLDNRTSLIQSQEGFCDNVCAGRICEYIDCPKGVHKKNWKTNGGDWQSHYCSSDHRKLDNGADYCLDCSKIFTPKCCSHTRCKPCYKKQFRE